MKRYTNNKNGKEYVVLDTVTNATNSQDGQKMILYCSTEDGELYVREKKEFLKKFTKKKDSISKKKALKLVKLAAEHEGTEWGECLNNMLCVHYPNYLGGIYEKAHEFTIQYQGEYIDKNYKFVEKTSTRKVVDTYLEMEEKL